MIITKKYYKLENIAILTDNYVCIILNYKFEYINKINNFER